MTLCRWTKLFQTARPEDQESLAFRDCQFHRHSLFLQHSALRRQEKNCQVTPVWYQGFEILRLRTICGPRQQADKTQHRSHAIYNLWDPGERFPVAKHPLSNPRGSCLQKPFARPPSRQNADSRSQSRQSSDLPSPLEGSESLDGKQDEGQLEQRQGH